MDKPVDSWGTMGSGGITGTYGIMDMTKRMHEEECR
jgi:hypothetical protein